MDKRYSCRKAADVRDAVSKALYARVFRWMVARINSYLQPRPSEEYLQIGMGGECVCTVTVLAATCVYCSVLGLCSYNVILYNKNYGSIKELAGSYWQVLLVGKSI